MSDNEERQPVTDQARPGQRATEFLAAFNDIEQTLRERLSARNSLPFTQLARQAEQKRWINAHQLEDLLEYAELRNAISHGRYTDNLRPIADPLPETVRDINDLREHLLHPARAISVLPPQKTRVYEPTTPLAQLLDDVKERKISKFPVYHEDSFHGLLSSTDVLQWIASNPGSERTQLRELLSHQKRSHTVFLPRTASALEAVNALTQPRKGRLPRALIINEGGVPNHRPIRIVTGADLPILVKSTDAF